MKIDIGLNKETRIAETVVYCEICKYWNVQNSFSDDTEYKLGNCSLRMGEPTYDDDYCSKGCLKQNRRKDINGMTVKELIEILKTKEQDKEVFIDSVEAGHLEKVLDGTEDYCGLNAIILSV